MRPLIHNYGSAYTNILKYIDEDSTLAEKVAHSTILKAEIVHAVRDEMSAKLADVVFRRTELGPAGHPGDEALRTCASLMAQEKGWDESRTQRELVEVSEALPRF